MTPSTHLLLLAEPSLGCFFFSSFFRLRGMPSASRLTVPTVFPLYSYINISVFLSHTLCINICSHNPLHLEGLDIFPFLRLLYFHASSFSLSLSSIALLSRLFFFFLFLSLTLSFCTIDLYTIFNLSRVGFPFLSASCLASTELS